jgi:hypothetical protein
MSKEKYYIQNQITNESYDISEGKFYDSNWSPELTDDKDYLQLLCGSDPEKFEWCRIETIQLREVFVIADGSANTFGIYMTDEWNNTADISTAWQFESEEEAQKIIDNAENKEIYYIESFEE